MIERREIVEERMARPVGRIDIPVIRGQHFLCDGSGNQGKRKERNRPQYQYILHDDLIVSAALSVACAFQTLRYGHGSEETDDPIGIPPSVQDQRTQEESRRDQAPKSMVNEVRTKI